jgi:nitroreductase
MNTEDLMTTLAPTPFRKPAEAAHPIHDLIRERWSPRAFADRPVEPATLHSLFEAARWAASGGNQQPWYFIVGDSAHDDDHARLVGTLLAGNVRWAQHAPVLILVVARLYERPGAEYVSLYDTGMAVGNLVMQAVAHGLVTHQMGGFDVEKARETLGIPEGYRPVAMIALGYPGHPDTLPDDLRTRELEPRTRRPLEEFVFAGRWGQPDLAVAE